MRPSTLFPAALAALTLAGVTTAANASPTREDGDYVVRAVPTSNNPHDVFKRLVTVPRHDGMAATHDCPAMKDPAMRATCDRMMGEHPGRAPTPKG